MKAAFILTLATLVSACLDLKPPDAGEAELAAGCSEDCPTHGLSGELILFVNGRLSSADALYQSNVPLVDDGTFRGPSLYLYDPLRTCDDGGNACRLAQLGALRLDERLGDLSVEDGSLRKLTLVDVAWSEQEGLWATTYDAKNDEWGLAALDVIDFAWSGQEIGIDRWVIRPGDAQSPATDPCYWPDAMSGLSFVDGELLLGVRGRGGVGLPDKRGAVFSVDLDVLRDQGRCQYPEDPSEDPDYYACDVVCSRWASFPNEVGVAGDLEEAATEGTALAMTRVENDAVGPIDRQTIYEIAMDAEPPVEAEASNLYVEPVTVGLDLEGLARVGGRLFAIDVWGRVLELDENDNIVGEHDDLSTLFPDYENSLRVRGATRVIVPAP